MDTRTGTKVTKNVLMQYADLQQEVCELRSKVSRLEEQLAKIEREGLVVDSVRGGFGGNQSFRIEGFPYPEYSRKKTLLCIRREKLAEFEMRLLELLNEVEEFIFAIDDSHMRRIVNLRVVEGLTWNQVACIIGGGNTECTVKKAFHRFIDGQMEENV